MLEVFEVCNFQNTYKVFMSRDFTMQAIYGTGYELKILPSDIITIKNTSLKKLQYFVKAELCTLTKFKKIMKDCSLYDGGKQVNVPYLMEIGMVGVVVTDEDNIPLYFCVHRDLVREYKKIRNKRQFLKFAA